MRLPLGFRTGPRGVVGALLDWEGEGEEVLGEELVAAEEVDMVSVLRSRSMLRRVVGAWERGREMRESSLRVPEAETESFCFEGWESWSNCSRAVSSAKQLSGETRGEEEEAEEKVG